MINIFECVDLFETGQYGRFYVVSYISAAGRPVFVIQILPKDTPAIINVVNKKCNLCLNKDAVEVFGVISEHPTLTIEYGWIHKGKWIDDFEKLIEQKRCEIINEEKENSDKIEKEKSEKIAFETHLLEQY